MKKVISTKVGSILGRLTRKKIDEKLAFSAADCGVCGSIGAGLPAPGRQAARRAPLRGRVSRYPNKDGVCRRKASTSRSGEEWGLAAGAWWGRRRAISRKEEYTALRELCCGGNSPKDDAPTSGRVSMELKAA
ncbi:hypothetical protein KM043_007967 [Ampulex compressa]|nr:hypothetical protein KM043_007967 [Ampulex compressa]